MDLVAQLGGQLALRLDEGEDDLLAVFEIAQVGQALIEGAQGDIVHAARGFLAVAGNEGDGVALVDKRHDGVDHGRAHLELIGKELDDARANGPLVLGHVLDGVGDRRGGTWRGRLRCRRGIRRSGCRSARRRRLSRRASRIRGVERRDHVHDRRNVRARRIVVHIRHKRSSFSYRQVIHRTRATGRPNKKTAEVQRLRRIDACPVPRTRRCRTPTA